MKNSKAVRGLSCLVLWLTLLASCTPLQAPLQAPLQEEDQTYRTPIPESTLKAYRFGTPIANKLQAAIAARALLSTTRLENLQPPEVIDVQRITLAEAKKKVLKPGEGSSESIPPETPVWLVIFKGKWQVHRPIPGVTVTPPPPYQGCQYVWMVEANNGFSATGNIDCPGE